MNAIADTRSRGHTRWLLAVLVVCAIILRLAFWFLVVGFDTPGGGDEPDYHRLASTVAAGQGLLSPEGEPTAARPPLYPVLLGGLYRLTGTDPDAGRMLQVGLGALIVILVYVAARRLLSERVALLAAALAALNPSLIYVSALLLTENLYIVLMLLVVLLLARAYEAAPARLSPFVWAGSLAGLCTLARPTGSAFAALSALSILLFPRIGFGKRVGAALVFLLVTAAVVAPWAARNHAQLGKPIFSTTHGGITFYESNNHLVCENPEFRGIVVLPRTAVPRWDELEGLGEVERDREAWRMGLSFVRENPKLLPKMAWWKFARFWRVRSGLGFGKAAGSGGRSGPLGVLAARPDILSVYWAAMIPLFVLGLIVTRRQRRRLLLTYAIVLAHVGTALIIHGSLRARTPVEPFIVIFAAAALVWAVSTLRGGRVGQDATGQAAATPAKQTTTGQAP